MADYHAILKRAISALPTPNGEARRAVYEKARAALVGQLKSFDPPLTPSEITQQRLQLEEAIRKVESEAAKGLLKPTPTAPPVVAASPPPSPPPPSAPPVPDAPIAVAPSAERPVPPPTAPAPVPPPIAPVPPIAAPTQVQAPVIDGSAQALKRVVDEAGALGAATAELGRQARDALTAEEDRTAATFGRETAEPPRKRETEQRRRRRPEPLRGGGKGNSRLPVVIGITAAILVFVIGIVALWSQREAISALFGGSGEQVIDLSKRQGEKLNPKATDRLGSDEGAGKVGNAKSVPTQTITTSPQLAANGNGNGGGAEASPKAPSILPQPQAVALVAQKAILYEEGKAGAQALISPGKVVWELVADATDPKPGAKMIRLRVDIPDRRIAAVIQMRPNGDTSFPASHMIEVRFDLPTDFEGRFVSNLPGLILKATEQSRGDPLSAATAKVADNFFWVALGAGEQEKARNFRLLKERGWIDVPILFENGRRAILTIEKSGAGDQVVSDAFAAWGVGG